VELLAFMNGAEFEAITTAVTIWIRCSAHMIDRPMVRSP